VMAGAVMHWLFIYNWADGQETTVNAAWAKVPVAVESLES
jgi:hypothetical protein